jgi:hypothetical protein
VLLAGYAIVSAVIPFSSGAMEIQKIQSVIAE